MPGWRITAFIRQAAEGAVEVIDISPKGFIHRAHVGQSYADEGAAKAAISESFRVWSGNTALPATVAVVYIDEPPDPRLTGTPDDESAPEAENESGEPCPRPDPKQKHDGETLAHRSRFRQSS